MQSLRQIASALCVSAANVAAAFAPFQAGTGSWQLAAPAVGNIDNDPALEIVVASRNSNGLWTVDAFDYTGARLSGFPFNSGSKPVNASPTLFDLDGDGKSEILFTSGNQILALRGTGSVMWSHTVIPLNYIPNAGFHALTNGFYLSGIPLFQPTLPVTAEFYSEVSPPLVVDADGDGAMEVLTAWKIDPDKLGLLQDYNPHINDLFGGGEWGITGEEWSGGVLVHDARTGEQKLVYHFHQLVEAGLAAAQLDADPATEVLVLNDADGVVAFDMTKPHGLFGSGMLHKKFGKNLRLLSGSYLTGVDVEVADLDGDGFDEVLVPTTQVNPNWQPSETILDDDGSVLWREWKSAESFNHVHGWQNSAVLMPLNPDRDNRIDVIGFTHSSVISFRSWDGVKLAGRPGWPKDFAPLMPVPPVAGDVDGDGQEEIVIGTYHPSQGSAPGTLHVFALNGTLKTSVPLSSGIKHIPCIADVDADGNTEVVFRTLDGKVHIQSFGNGAPSRVSWAGHRGSSARINRRDLYPPGTPILTGKTAAFGRIGFSWRISPGFAPSVIKIYRASAPEGPFTEISTLPPGTTSFQDLNLPAGTLWVYEVRALYSSRWVSSAPIALTADFSRNLLLNGHFELDDDSGWDKWFSGNIPWANMIGSSATVRSGRQSMEIKLSGHASNSSITQYSHFGMPEDYLPVQPGKLYSFGGFIRTTGLNASTRHWLEWDSSRTAENTNARPSLPWPDYFTPSAVLQQATGWTYLNRVFPVPAGFPNVQLRHRFSAETPASGSIFLDDLFFRELPDPADSKWITWVPFGSNWRYRSTTPEANWYSSSFNDLAWPEAPAKFGNGGGPRNIVTAIPKNQPAYFFRTTFVAANSAYEEFLLAATCTDDYGGTVYPLRIWINGTEVGEGLIHAVTGEGNDVKYFDLAPFIHLVRPGTNVVAVMLQNTWQATWDNVAFDVSLKAIPAIQSASAGGARFDAIRLSENGRITLVVTADTASQWRIESSDSARPFQWATVHTVTFSTPATASVLDIGQNGRLPPANVKTRYYRLVKVS